MPSRFRSPRPKGESLARSKTSKAPLIAWPDAPAFLRPWASSHLPAHHPSARRQTDTHTHSLNVSSLPSPGRTSWSPCSTSSTGVKLTPHPPPARCRPVCSRSRSLSAGDGRCPFCCGRAQWCTSDDLVQRARDFASDGVSPFFVLGSDWAGVRRERAREPTRGGSRGVDRQEADLLNALCIACYSWNTWSE